MTAQRPTTLQLFLDHCPKAVDLYEAGALQDRAMFAVGTAAHEFLQAIGEGRDLDRLAAQLITVGRYGDDAEGPLHPDAVFEGRQLVELFLAKIPFPVGALYEQRYAFDRSWQPVEWGDPAAWFRTRIDVVQVIEGEDEDGFAVSTVVVDDYKSAWPAGENELDTLQRRAQAVCAWLTYGSRVGSITMRISNLRRREQSERVIPLDEDGEAVLRRWRDDLDIVIAAANQRPRIARPGARCGGCPYIRACEEGRALVKAQGGEFEDVIRSWRAAETLGSQLKAIVKEAADQHGAFTVDGLRIGPVPTETRIAKRNALAASVGAWLGRAGVEVTDTLRNALEGISAAAGPMPVGFLENIAKALYPGRQMAQDRKAWIAEQVETKIEPRFTVVEVEHE